MRLFGERQPVVLHIPHASKVVPEAVRPTLVLSDADLEVELIRMTDSYTDELFALPGNVAVSVVFPVSRLVVDPERFTDDAQEPMAARGMGVVYTLTSDGRPLRRHLSAEERQSLIERYYEPHHRKLTGIVEDMLARSGRCLILDCHSFPSRPLPYEPDQSPLRPDICIGTDEYHTPDWLRDLAVALFRHEGFSVAVNRPFSGALVPMAHYRRVPRVWSIMVEVNRSQYMDELTGARSDQFTRFRALLQSILLRLLRGVQEHD